ncbi:flagellar basal body-associated protein FliL [Bradyrhizobium sp. URHC0002]
MKRNVSYAIIIPIAVVCFAVVLMLWSMAGTNGGGTTTGSAYTRPNEMPVQAPTAPSNDTAADSARTPNTPLNKSR